MKLVIVNLLVVTLWCARCHASDALETLTAKATHSTGEDYVTARSQLVTIGKKDPHLLRVLVESSSDWQDKTIAAIVLEYVEKEASIKDVLQWRPPQVSERVPSRRIGIYGEMLKDRAKSVPLFLVEKIWKGNELQVRPYDAENIACVSYTLGVLKVPESRRPLESLLDHEDYHVRVTAAQALGALGSPDSVKPLLDFIAKGYGGKLNPSHVAASDSLARCVNKSSLPLLRNALEEIKTGRLQDQRNQFKALLELEIMALDK